MESIFQYVRRRLLELGSGVWEDIAAEASAHAVASGLPPEVCDVSPSTPRKLVYDRKDPSVNTIEALSRYLQAAERGEVELPRRGSHE